jgi:hypothetical protein
MHRAMRDASAFLATLLIPSHAENRPCQRETRTCTCRLPNPILPRAAERLNVGAVEETRTLTPFGTAPSRQRVYQFHHDGIGTETFKNVIVADCGELLGIRGVFCVGFWLSLGISSGRSGRRNRRDRCAGRRRD